LPGDRKTVRTPSKPFTPGTISHNLQAASIRREAESSLKRLGVERIDLYQIHQPAWKDQPESASPSSIEEAMQALVALQQEGKIRRFGVSNFKYVRADSDRTGAVHANGGVRPHPEPSPFVLHRLRQQ